MSTETLYCGLCEWGTLNFILFTIAPLTLVLVGGENGFTLSLMLCGISAPMAAVVWLRISKQNRAGIVLKSNPPGEKMSSLCFGCDDCMCPHQLLGFAGEKILNTVRSL